MCTDEYEYDYDHSELKLGLGHDGGRSEESYLVFLMRAPMRLLTAVLEPRRCHVHIDGAAIVCAETVCAGRGRNTPRSLPDHDRCASLGVRPRCTARCSRPEASTKGLSPAPTPKPHALLDLHESYTECFSEISRVLDMEEGARITAYLYFSRCVATQMQFKEHTMLLLIAIATVACKVHYDLDVRCRWAALSSTATAAASDPNKTNLAPTTALFVCGRTGLPPPTLVASPTGTLRRLSGIRLSICSPRSSIYSTGCCGGALSLSRAPNTKRRGPRHTSSSEPPTPETTTTR